MRVDPHRARHGLPLDVDQELALPLTSPEFAQVSRNTTDVYLQLALLVEADRGASFVFGVLSLDICVNLLVYSSSKYKLKLFNTNLLVSTPLFIELDGEVALGSSLGDGHRKGIK